jgi:phospholipase A1
MKVLMAGVVCSALIGTAFANEDAKFIESVEGGTHDFHNQGALLACMAEELKTASTDMTAGELRERCSTQINSSIDERIIYEKQASSNPFAILPYKPNYILPFTYSKPREEPYGDLLQGESFDDVEIKFQISIKFLVSENLFAEDLDVHVAFTSTSYWQAYNSDISAPFRETNYEPEIIFSYNKPWSLLGIPVIHSSLSLNHQSNGQGGILSRSWNRVIGGIAMTSGDFVWNTRVWWRIPEDGKQSPTDISGDDNPNIEKYMGYGDLGILWKLPKQHNLDILLRNNLRSDNKGAVQVGWSFPLLKHLRGYVEYFDGYGESLIYYDQHIQRFGVGVKLTDWL